jgi:hypothetical protein
MRQVLDTAVKPRPTLNDNSLAFTNQYTIDNLAFIWITMCRVVKKVSTQRTKNGPESQWCSVMVAPILSLLHELYRDAEGGSQLEILMSLPSPSTKLLSVHTAKIQKSGES